MAAEHVRAGRDTALEQVFEVGYALISSLRAVRLGMQAEEGAPVRVHSQSHNMRCTQWIAGLVDPLESPPPGREAVQSSGGDALDALALDLCKQAGLLPAALCVRQGQAAPLQNALEEEPFPVLHAGQYRAARLAAQQDVAAVSDASVPLAGAEDARIVVFRSPLSVQEHLAVIVRPLALPHTPLVRVHSSCLTGDVLESLRCDCGEQLRQAIRYMAAEGGGILLYLSQEGRGIGIANKLRAYRLQDAGWDTVDANLELGFEGDERHFGIAASMLRALGAPRIRLLTNNPLKMEQLESQGIDIAERVALHVAPGAHNARYLDTKATRCGHLL